MPMKLEEIQTLYDEKITECNKYRAFEQQNHTLLEKAARLEDTMGQLLK